MAVNRLWMSRLNDKTRLFLDEGTDLNIPTPIVKRMHQSFVEEFLPFASDPGLLEDYANAFGSIRFGKILEDLDALAGSIAYAHADDFKDDTKPLTIVTASLDSVNVQRELAMDKDYRMYGFVSYVGSSSMEITIVVSEMEGGYGEVARQREQQQTTSEWPNESLISQVEGQLKNAVMTASFTMVGRDPKTGKAAKVNRLALESDFERKVFALGEQHKRARLLQSQKAPDKQKPNEEEMRLIHDIYLETKPYKDPSSHLKMPADKVWMKDTVRQSIQFSFPQDRNIHGNIFGGWLMKQAYELAFSTGLMFCRTRPTFVLLEEVVFKKPVSVGSLLYFTGQVVYTDANCFQVKVKADVVDPLGAEGEAKVETTNLFYFRFTAPKIPSIMPRSYNDCMKYIEGRRRTLQENHT